MRITRLLLTTLAVAMLSDCALARAEGTPATLATASVRVEGTSETLLPATPVTTTLAPVVNDGNPSHACAGTSALGGLQDATGGHWSGHWSESLHQYEVLSVLGETHLFEPLSRANYFWSFWLNDKRSEVGLCEATLRQGDRLLMVAECFGEACPSPEPLPLEVESPSTVNAGEAVAVTVRRYNPEGVGTEVAGARIEGAGVSATTDAQGHATLTLSQLGPSTLRVTAPASIRTEAAICVHHGNDGTCGTPLPGAATGNPTESNAVSPEPNRAHVAGVLSGHVYRAGQAPRILDGTVLVPQGKALREVRIGIERRVGRRCWTFSGARAAFVRSRCTRHPRVFSAGNEASFSYLLPARLPRGSYTYAVEAIDGSGHASPLVAGLSEVAFRVA
jgi:hypothetical protein